MRSHAVLTAVVLAALGVCLGQLRADPDAGSGSGSPSSSGSGSGSDQGSGSADAGSGSGSAVPAKTNAEMHTDADSLVGRMTQQVQGMQDTQLKARKDKDTLRINCIDLQLLVAQTVLRSGETALGELRIALGTNDTAAVTAAYDKITSLAGEADKANTAAGECVGSGAVKPKPLSWKTAKNSNGIDDPTNDCNTLGLASCQLRPLENVAWASPFIPN